MGEWRRFVAIGDSLTEGIGDLGMDGVPNGWADRFAAGLAAEQGELRYANLAIRGLTTAEVLATQLAPAVALRPDLASAVVGMNDLIRPLIDLPKLRTQLNTLVGVLTASGAVVLTATLPNPGSVVRLPSVVQRRFDARVDRFNDLVREVSADHGARCLDIARHPMNAPDLRCEDRLHPSPYGHQRIAESFLHLLEVRGGNPVTPHSGGPASGGSPADLIWMATTVGPWLWRKVTGRQSSLGVLAKLPDYRLLRPVG
jgi:lysophospholipase L1-like esterase